MSCQLAGMILLQLLETNVSIVTDVLFVIFFVRKMNLLTVIMNYMMKSFESIY